MGVAQLVRVLVCGAEGRGFEPHRPPVSPLRNGKGFFLFKGHKRDTLNKIMKPYSEPKINRSDPNKWFIYYNYIVPPELQNVKHDKTGKLLFPRSTHRFKIYTGLNQVPLEQREKAALELRENIHLLLKNNLLNPFRYDEKMIAEPPIIELTREDQTFHYALSAFIESRKLRKVEPKTINAYQSCIDWIVAGTSNMLLCKQLKHIDMSAAMDKQAKQRNWSATTINKEWSFATTILNWMVTEDYLPKNPSAGKVVKLATTKSIHKWYDRETAKLAKEAIKTSGKEWLLRVCQFTYHILIRSKAELMSLKVGDIDLELRTIYFRKEWTKNSADQNRDYSDDFHKILLEMKIDKLPKDWYIFGTGGEPGPVQPGHNFFSFTWEKIRSSIGLSHEYTIYGWKHTRVVHEMMKGTDGYMISHMARHSDTKTTNDYKRDYDITLNKVYSAEDLKF